MDCQLYARDFMMLDSIAATASMSLSGTVVLGGILPSELPALAMDFRLSFPVSVDSTGTHGQLLEYLGTTGPVVTIWRHNLPVALLVGSEAIPRAALLVRGERTAAP